MPTLSRLTILALAVTSSAFCTAAQTPEATSPDPQPVTDPYAVLLTTPHPFLAEDRVEVVSPNQPLKLAEENELSLKIHVPGLSTLESNQTSYLQEGVTLHIDGSTQQLPILRHNDGSAYIKFVPLALGKLELFVFGTFPDGGFWRTQVMCDVEPPARKPAIFHIGGFGPAENVNAMSRSRARGALGPRPDLGWIHLDFGISSRISESIPQPRHINPQAVYEGVPQVIPIPAQLIAFTVKTKDEVHVIDLDEKTGMITPVQPGHAVIEASYGGVTDRACVVVTQWSESSDRSECEELYPAEPPSVYKFSLIVQDSEGNAIPNAKVSVADEPNPPQFASTDENGLFSVQLSTTTRFVLLDIVADGFRELKTHLSPLSAAQRKRPPAVTLWRPSEQPH